MVEYKGRTNRLGIWGWLGGGRWGWERYLYTLHRVTGLGTARLLPAAHRRHDVPCARAAGVGSGDGAG